MFRKYRVDKLVYQHFWEGFWRFMDGEIGGRGRMLHYSARPDWWDEVSDIALKAGYDAAEHIKTDIINMERTGKHHLGTGGKEPVIPTSVYAEAYAAARIAKIAFR